MGDEVRLAQGRDKEVTQRPGEEGGRTVLQSLDTGAFQFIVIQAFQLHRMYRDVFLLKDVKGYTSSEVALLLGISRRTVLTRLREARRQMRGALNQVRTQGRSSEPAAEEAPMDCGSS
jgi:DNA-directed RNA polymerase specialized sigma24 family protein